MKPVVSSIVALAIAIAPFAAMASPETSADKPNAAKVMKQHHPHKKADKTTKVDKVDKGDKDDKDEAVRRVHHSGKAILKPVLHHAHNADVGGAGHKEPKVEKGVAVIPASLSSKVTHGKTASHKAEAKPAPMPKLPNPNATKASRSGNEKGARKSAEKKADDGGDNDGKPGRDEDFKDLVARIRGQHELKSDIEPKADPKIEPSESKAKIRHEGGKPRRASVTIPPCAKDPIEIIRGPEIDKFELTKCDGTLAPLAVEHLSVAIRPGSAARPVAPLLELAKKKGAELAHGVHRVDERLATRIQALADHFAKPGTPLKFSVVSGIRPTSIGSMHATGRAIDFRLEGTKNEDVVAFCKTLTDTGCGYYPNSSFVHLDVRDLGAGQVSWIDASGPGETPRYVTSWPPPSKSSEKADRLEPVSAKLPLEDQDGMREAASAHPGDSPQ
jgi:Bacterial protein of unknown function (DUF882)